MPTLPRRAVALLLAALTGLPTLAQHAPDAAPSAGPVADPADLLAPAIHFLLDSHEDGAWPYEGVYRVRGRIPAGYVVGGTALVAQALLEAPGYADDPARQAAVATACGVVCAALDDPAMGHEIDGGYDVRGWGWATGLAFLSRLRRDGAVPEGQGGAVTRALVHFSEGLAVTAIPEQGGWNYSRRAGFDAPGDSSPFMTGTTLQALFDAAAVGVPVDPDLVTGGLDALEASRTALGSYVYAGPARPGRPHLLPGAVGRMLVAECTLRLAGRGSDERLRGALDAFLVHWDALEVRRAQTGTHAPPWGVAPYYVLFAHRYAAQAAELLPEGERAVYRRKVRERLLACGEGDGTWNDRVFERSASYGTALAVMVLSADTAPAPTRWTVPD